MKIDLRKYQKIGVRRIQKWKGRALLADEMGLGKTIQCLFWIHKKYNTRPFVIVCPASMKYTWAHEAKSKFGMNSLILEGTRPPGQVKHIKQDLVIVNYDILDAWKVWLSKANVKGIVLDECHYIKNRATKRYKATKYLAKNLPHVIGVSGTPLTNRPSELWPILNLLDKKAWPNFMQFAFKYCKPKKTPWGWKFEGAINLDILHRRLKKTCMIRRKKKDVLKELPDKERTVVPLDITRRQDYKKADADFIKWIKAENAAAASRATRATQLVRVAKLNKLAVTLALPSIFQWVDNFLEESEEKIVLFGWHTDILDALSNRYKNSVRIDGSVPSKDRLAIVDKFQNDRRIRVFIGNLKAAGTGVTLTAASTLAFVELGKTPGDHGQTEDRVHRYGQTKKCNIVYLVAKDTIMEKAARLIQSKQKVLDSVLDGGKQEGSFNVFELLIQDALKNGK